MKNLTLIFSLFLLIGLQACQKEETPDVDQDPANNGIEGVWDLVRADQDNGLIVTDGQQAATYYSRSSNPKGSYKIYSDGTFKSETGYTNNLFMDIFGTVFEQIQTIPLTKVNGSYTFDSNTMKFTVTNNNQTTVYDVEELTDNKLLMTTSIYQSKMQNGSTSITTALLTVELER